ncbi:hypothetical protein [Fulvitalea axinellae]
MGAKKMNGSFLGKALAYMKTKLSILPKQIQSDFQKNLVKFRDVCLIHRAQIDNGGGKYPLLRTSNNKRVGYSDFQEDKLEGGQNVAVTRLKIGYSMVASGDSGFGAANESNVRYSDKAADLPNVLLSSVLSITQDNNTVFRQPISALVSEESMRGNASSAALDLEIPFLLVERKPINVEIQFPEGEGTSESDKHFFEFQLFGVETASK